MIVYFLKTLKCFLLTKGLETSFLKDVQENDVMETTPVQVVYTQEENWTEPGSAVVSSSGRGGRPPRGRGRPRSRGKKPAVSGRPPRAAANSNGEASLRPRAQPRAGRKNGRRIGTKSRKRPTKGTLGISNEVGGGGGRRAKEVVATAKTALPDNEDWIETPEMQDDDGEASSSGRSFQYKDYDDIMAPIDDFDGGGQSSKLVGRGEFSLHSDDEYEEEEDMMNTKMDVNVDDEDEDYINEDSDGKEQPEISIDAARKRFPFVDPDLTSSSSSDFQ